MTDTLSALRSLMASHSPPLDALVIPSQDYHQSEYVSARDKRREFVSGFNGSAGLALVTMNDARLWTDGRYFLQATQQLSDQWKLMRMGEDPAVDVWMAENLPKEARIGVDPWCVSVDTAQRWESAFTPKLQKLVQTSTNLVDEVWKNRPPAETNPAMIHPLEFSGHSVGDKLKDLREKLTNKNSHGIVITTLDEVAWLYNIRGSDVSYCPVVHAFAIVTTNSAFLYVDNKKISSEVHMSRMVKPGYYEDGNFGIRLENVLVIKKTDTKFNFGDKGYLSFEHITWVPYQVKLIDLSLLTPEEINWLNNYHSKCKDILAPYLNESEMAWLKKATDPVNAQLPCS